MFTVSLVYVGDIVYLSVLEKPYVILNTIELVNELLKTPVCARLTGLSLI